jgi:peptide-N4-(N-acetyl-beta-glucosaminyl)asparagine amidase
MQYENEVARIQALSVIPVELVEMKGDGDSVDEPKLLKDLLTWFKSSFFKWVDSPNCDRCHHSTQAARGDISLTLSLSSLFLHRRLSPNRRGKRSRRVEGRAVQLHELQCTGSICTIQQCDNAIGDEVITMISNRSFLTCRKGRCGEWANCFTLCARAVGFDVR